MFDRFRFLLKVVRRKLLKQRLPVWFYHRFVLPHLVARLAFAAQQRPVSIVFLAMNPDMWRYGDVYRKFAADSRFDLQVLTVPYVHQTLADRLAIQEKMIQFCKTNGFSAVRGLDPVTHCPLDLAALKPDIVFYTQPYDGCIDSSFEFSHHWGTLHCYAPYSFQLSRVEWGWNNNLQNYCWKQFFVNASQVQLAREVAIARGCNMVAAGYCMEEEQAAARADRAACEAVWKGDTRKRVIWAPHHSINEGDLFRVSSFLEICDLMVELRDAYRDKIVFAFKPHPALKARLCERWGKEKTDAYYDGWATADNAFDAQGDYRSLFAGSDAMIHCSASFIFEYLYTGKPVQYVFSKTRRIPVEWGEAGQAALAAHQPAHEPEDIRRFLEDVVLGGKDDYRARREEVASTYLKSPNGKGFSQNVYDEIVKGLGLACPTR